MRLKVGKIYLFKFLIYMNRFGEVICVVLDWYKLLLFFVFIIYDDMDLLMGWLWLWLFGLVGGYNGMKLAIVYLGIFEFFCLWIGIGKFKNFIVESGELKIISYVLGKFSFIEN